MALPTLEKTWQYTVNQLSITTGTALGDARKITRAIKDALLALASNPYTVIGSSDSVTSNMSGTDLWDSDTDLVYAAANGTAHSWIVLEQDAINASTQILISLVGNTNTNGAFASIYLSPSVGFGTANGGTDGSNVNRPTATDEILINVPTNGYLTGSTSTAGRAGDWVYHFMTSPDGQCTRILIRQPGTAFTAFFVLDKPRTPVSSWTSPVVSMWHSNTTNATAYADLLVLAKLKGRANAASMDLFITSEGWANLAGGQNLTGINEIQSEWELFQAGLASATVGNRGRHGSLFDLYWCSSSLTEGDSFPSDGTRQFTSVGDLVVPWNGTVMRLA
jgi:hypothetical protein